MLFELIEQALFTGLTVGLIIPLLCMITVILIANLINEIQYNKLKDEFKRENDV